MKYIHVGKTRPIQTITEALKTTSYEEPLTILLDEGIYKEKIECYKKILCIIGKSRESTRIIWDDGAFKKHEDGKRYGTFRSHTALFDGDCLKVEGVTIENQAGLGQVVGQAVAAAVYTQYVYMKEVKLISYQDTLFLGPLPDKEKMIDGFLGPKQYTERIQSYQLYEGCEIEGDVDFIFGGGNGIFLNCKLYGKGERTGFLAAPSTKEKELGFYFERCFIDAQIEQNLYLARPWRSYGKAIFIHCHMTKGVNEKGFDPWDEKERNYLFGEYPEQEKRREGQTQLTKEEIIAIRTRANLMKKNILKEIAIHR